MSEDRSGQWQPLGPPDIPDLIRLAERVLAADGGLPLATGRAFLYARYAGPGVRAVGVRGVAGHLVAAAAIRTPAATDAVITAMVDPRWRGQGLGGYALDWAMAAARDTSAGSMTVETESLTDAAAALFASRGLRQTFAEDVMRFDLAAPLPVINLPEAMTLVPWTPQLAGRFFAVYQAAFRERAGFPNWSAARWIEWLCDGGEFSPELTLLATENGADDVGFIACATGWIIQVGVRTDRRGRHIGAALVVAALRGMRDAGAREALLDVAVDNPACRLYQRLGFTAVGRRARFGPI